MKLSQKAIQRMVSGQGGSGGGGGSSLDPSMLAGMATQAWVEDGYISKAFWAELFVIHKKVTTVVMDGETEISRTVDTSGVFTPNEIPETTSETDEETGYVTTVTTEINHIEFKKGAWTNYFLSALGLNPSGGGGGGSSTLAGLLDVELTNPSNGQALIYDGNPSSPTYGKWINGTVQSGISMSDVWTALAAADNTKQIDYSHLSSAISINNGTITIGTNTITPLTSLPVDGYDTRYLKLTGGTLTLNGIGLFTVKNTSSNYPLIRFEGNAAGGIGFIGIGKTGSNINPYYVTADTNGGYTDGVSQWYTILHTGNWSDTINLTSLGAASSSSVSTLQGYFTNGVANQAARLSGNGSYTAWGQTYWSSGVPSIISGNMTDVGNITMSGDINMQVGEYINMHIGNNDRGVLGVWGGNLNLFYLGYYTAIEDHYPTCIYGYPLRLYGNSTMGICIDTSGNVGIGTTSPSYKLEVNGTAYIGDALSVASDISSSGGNLIGFYGLEMRGLNSSNEHVGFIDFHYNNTNNDYSSRFIETDYGLMKLMSKNSIGNGQRAALVVGEGYTSSYIQIGDIRLVCDSNHDLRVVMANGAAANLYATGGISALGMSAGTSSIDEMTFGYLNVNNELNFGSSAKIYMDDFFYIDSDAHVSVNGVEFENNNAHANKLYLGNSQYLYVSGGTLYYYNGSSSKVISS